MDKRVVGTLLGIGGMWLWFMPWRQFSIEAFDFNQTGSHMGGVAYMLLMSSFAYAVLAWLPQPVPRIIVAAVATLLAGLFWLSFGESAAWGLVGLCLVSGVSLIEAVQEHSSFKHAEQSKASKDG